MQKGYLSISYGIKKLLREYYEELYDNKFNNTNEVNKFLGKK